MNTDRRTPIAWAEDTPYGRVYSFAEEFFEAFPTFPNLPADPAKSHVGALDVSDEAIERALEAKIGLDNTLRQLIRGDTVAVGYSKVDVVRALLAELGSAASAQQPDHTGDANKMVQRQAPAELTDDGAAQRLYENWKREAWRRKAAGEGVGE
jgi:hypothetical protein